MGDEFDGVLERDRTGYDPTTDTYHDRHDWDGDATLATTIAEAVADATDSDPMALPRLHDVIDTEALERALASMPGHEEGPPGYVRFSYADCTVSVASSGELCVDCDP